MLSASLLQAMPIVATALGRRFGVQVRVGGQQAATDGQIIWLPDLPPGSALRPVAWGLLAHEAAHVRHTDMALFRAAAQAGPLRRHLLNLLEDVRVERALRRDYPGTQATLARVIDWLLAEGRIQVPAEDAHPAEILTSALSLILRARVLDQTALLPLAVEAERRLRQTFPAPLVEGLLDHLAAVPGLDSTAAADALAARLLAWLDGFARTPTPETTPRAGTDPADPMPGNGGTEPAPPHPSDDGRDGDPDPEPGGMDAQEIGETDASSVPAPAEDPDARAARDRLGQVLNACPEDLGEDWFDRTRQGLAAASAGGPARLPAGEDPVLCRGEVLCQAVEAPSRRLRARLHGFVQAQRRDRPFSARRGQRPRAACLYRAGVGDTRLFVRAGPRPAPHTALHLVVDLSESMATHLHRGEPAYRLALDAALALALALETLSGVTVAVTAFPGQTGDPERVTRLVRAGQSVRARAGAFWQRPRGGTPLAQALWYAMADLSPRPQTRRVILVMTDGEPDDEAATRAVLALCQTHGFEAVGLGIGCDVSRLFPRSARVGTLADLQPALFRLTERVLGG